MVRFIRIAAVLGAAVVFAVCASPAPAAKGVKKTGEQHLRGKIVAVQHSRKGQGSITVQVTHHKQKKTAGARRQSGHTRTFTISRATRVQGAANGRRGGLGSLRAGEQVVIAAHQGHADSIAVHARTGTRTRTRNRAVRR